MSSSSSCSRVVGVAILAASLVQIYAFAPMEKLPTTAANRLSTRLTMSEVEDYDDPYGSLFDLNKPVDKLPEKELVDLWTIEKSNELDLPIVKARVKPLSAQHRWEHWDDFMESELGDLDADLLEKDKWMQDIRDAVELKRGFAIWSKKSDKDLQKESRRSLASRGMNVPENVALVIRAVFLEKTHTMKKFRKEEELACIDFRKFMIEQKKKLKKSPLPLAKSEVSRRWLTKHPNTSSSYSRTKPPRVILDELSLTTSTPGVAFSLAKLNPTASGSSATQSKTASASSPSGGGGMTNVVTPSMVYWDKPVEDVPVSWTRDPRDDGKISGVAGSKNGNNNNGGNNKGRFAVDGVDMFVASKANEEYFVVL